jgi:putative ABC transport system substrate-binding protein
MWRIGVLMALGENDPEAKAWLSAFTQGLQELGWTDGRNLRMEVRWAAGDVDRMRMFAKELVDLRPDAILSHTTPGTAALQRETRTIPVVFAGISDPVGDGFVAGLPRPGGNLTGFINIEASMAGKWLELLTEIAPGVKRVAIMFNPEIYPVYAMTRKSLGEMTRKLSVIRSRNRSQFFGMVRRRNVMIASRNSARVS